MCNNSIDLEFSDPEMARDEILNLDWQPFARAANIVATNIEKQPSPRNFSKRSRIHNEAEHYQKPIPQYESKMVTPTIMNSYAQATSTNVSEVKLANVTYQKPSITTKSTTKHSETALLQHQLKLLQISVEKMYKKNTA
jgi:hypothetical protein